MCPPQKALLWTVALAACSTVVSPGSDAGTTDAQATDAQATDARVTDAQVTDAQVTDAQVTDAQVTDAQVTDVGRSDAGCIDRIFNDPANCGACGHACGVHQQCNVNECVCVEGYGACVASGVCDTPLRDNPLHCGACGARCGEGERCDGLRCVRVACAPGVADCEDPATSCETDLSRADRHCGACGNACANGTRCAAGRCVSSAVTPQTPGSMLATTSARPWFRWAQGPGVDGARMQVCADPGCARVQLEVDVAGAQHRPAVALAEGLHFWRLFARRGAVVDATPTAVWAFVVPPADALGARETPPRLDLNGDGLDDEVIADGLPRRAYRLRVRYGGGARPEREVLSEVSAIEFWGASVVRAGDIDGDGLADAVLAVRYAQRYSPTQSDGGLMLFDVLGRRDGDPVVLLRGNLLRTGHPGPTLEMSLPLGNAPGAAGLLTLAGNAPHCEARLHRGVAGDGSFGNGSCADNLLTAGDYDANGRVEVVSGDPPSASSWSSEPTPMLRDCQGSQLFARFDSQRRALTADIDVDGYDDLVVLPSTGRPRHVIHGGPAGLDGARCTDLP